MHLDKTGYYGRPDTKTTVHVIHNGRGLQMCHGCFVAFSSGSENRVQCSKAYKIAKAFCEKWHKFRINSSVLLQMLHVLMHLNV